MKNGVGVGLGFLGAGIGAAIVCGITIVKVGEMDEKIANITKSIGSISDDVDLTVPEDVVKAAVSIAAKDAAIREANKAAKSISNVIESSVNKNVTEQIGKLYSAMEVKVKDMFDKSITLDSLERIENKVASKVAENVFKTYPTFNNYNGNSKEQIIKTCLENGMAGWEVENILKAMK